jgi:hypothetical protein
MKARGVPQRIYCDNGPEFVSLHLDQWAHWNHVQLDLSRPGRPSDNALCESFNNRVRQELLNSNWFACLDDGRLQARVWRRDYSTNHPHSSLGDLSPEEFPRRSAIRGRPRTCYPPPISGITHGYPSGIRHASDDFAIQVDGVGMMQLRPGEVVLGKLFQRIIQRLTTASRGCYFLVT